MTCSNCQHPAYAHEPSLFGVRCVARVLTDQPEWVDKGRECGCVDFVPLAEQGGSE